MPVTIIDGPAAGQGFAIRRAPAFLRVVYDPAADKWDALDQLTDEPEPTEVIHVYRLAAGGGTVHVCIRGRGSAGSGWYATGHYRYHEEDQAPDEILRDTERWRAHAIRRTHECGDFPALAAPPPELQG